MAAQKDVPSSDFSAETVGHAFVSQFYHILHNSPEMVHRFYQDSSTLMRPGPNGSLVTATTTNEINDLILSLDSKGCKAEIMTADAQASYMEGVIVLVTGCLTGKDNVRRKFTESFFLAPQDKGYFVLNDTFRFVEEDISAEDNSLEGNVEENATLASLPPNQEANEVSDNSLENHTVTVEHTSENNIEECDSSRNEETPPVKVVPEPPEDPSHNNVQPVPHQNNVQPVVEPVSNAHEATPKKSSYASIVMKENVSPLPVTSNGVKTPPDPKKQSLLHVAAATAEQTQETFAPVAAPESSAANGSNGHRNNTDPAEGDDTDKGYSIYIGNLPWEATPEEVEREFKRFGPIKPNGIQVRTNKGFTFGFVEFETPSAMQNAIKMKHLRIGGKDAFIEEKKTATRVVNGVSSFPSGRGGYRNESFRGRGNFNGGGRGYVRNDYGKRAEFSGRLQNGGHQRVYQNGGERAARRAGAQ